MHTTYEMAKDPKDPKHFPHAREDPRHSSGDSPSVPVVFESGGAEESSAPASGTSPDQEQGQGQERRDLGVTGTA
jgi:hypothetical protein